MPQPAPRSASASCLSVHRRQARTTTWRRRASRQRARDAPRGALQFLICDVACHVIAVALRNAVITARRKGRYNACYNAGPPRCSQPRQPLRSAVAWRLLRARRQPPSPPQQRGYRHRRRRLAARSQPPAQRCCRAAERERRSRRSTAAQQGLHLQYSRPRTRQRSQTASRARSELQRWRQAAQQRRVQRCTTGSLPRRPERCRRSRRSTRDETVMGTARTW